MPRDGIELGQCATPQTTGTGQAAMARTTRSSLKAHKSSMEPPPRQTMTASKRCPPRCARLMSTRACTIWLGASLPCTLQGEITTST
jgi:hypothetical protein